MFVRKMLARALPLTALGLAAWCPAYAVEEPVKADDVYVTATRVEKELQDVPMSVSVMTGGGHQAFSRPDHRRAFAGRAGRGNQEFRRAGL